MSRRLLHAVVIRLLLLLLLWRNVKVVADVGVDILVIMLLATTTRPFLVPLV